MNSPTTQAVEQLREKLTNTVVEIIQLPRGKTASEDLYVNEIISALVDTLKIVGEEIIGNDMKVPGLRDTWRHTDMNNAANNELRKDQRQRLELVVEEMKKEHKADTSGRGYGDLDDSAQYQYEL